jgi:phosphate transport system substrate-binding protein
MLMANGIDRVAALRSRSMRTALGLAAAAALLVIASLAAAPARAADVTLTETGSTLLKPLFDIWVPEYLKSHPGVQIVTAATGSGAGTMQALSGQVMLGASDAYMSDAEIRANPDFLDIPLAISAQTINYNLPGLSTTNLRLDGPTIAGIYTGAIRQWDAPAIKALNSGVELPHNDIVPVYRKDESGDTFIFTQFLAFSTPKWELHKNYGTKIDWPTVPGALGVQSNAETVQMLQATPDSIGYVGISYSADIAAGRLGTAMLKNEAGQFVLPTRDAIIDGAASLGVRTPPDERLTLVFAPGENSYPLVNYEYVVVSTKQTSPEVAAALRRFLLWAILPSEANEDYLNRVHFVPLPPHIWELSQTQIQSIR